jgi:signal transduction histidine kinase
MSVYLIGTSTSTLRGRLKDEVRAFAALATPPIGDSYNVYGQSGTGKINDLVKSYLEQNTTVVNVAIVDLQGSKLYEYKQDKTVIVTPEQASSFDPVFGVAKGNLQQVVTPYFGSSGAHSYSVVYSISNAATNAAIAGEARSLLIFSILSLIATSVVTFAAISYFILRPIRKVSEQAAKISSGDLEQQISIQGTNEIARLGIAVNAMADSLKANIAKLQEIDKVKSEFMAITSHNLRTPLTIINAYLDNVDTYDSVEELKKALSRIGDSVKRLDGFAEDVLTISRYELGEKHSNKDKVGMRELIEKIAEETKPTAEMHDLHFTYEISTDAKVLIGKPYLRSAVINVLDNAVKFTPKNGNIHLNAFEREGIVRVSVTDDGIGISDEEIPKLFTKFHRATSVSTYNYEGTGIGLYASKIIIEEAGGTITVETKKGKGSTFTINLPVAQ